MHSVQFPDTDVFCFVLFVQWTSAGCVGQRAHLTVRCTIPASAPGASNTYIKSGKSAASFHFFPPGVAFLITSLSPPSDSALH